MSNSLAIGAVSATLKYLLEEKLVQLGIDNSLDERPAITFLVPGESGTGVDPAKDRLNLFLYQTTLNPGWRNVGLPSLDSRGDRVANPPLALDLHYLLTAFSDKPFHAEVLLGYAMNLFHQVSVLTREDIRKALQKLQDNPGSNKIEKAIAAADLAEQVEQIKIIPQSTSTEELWKLWSAMQSQYRPTVTYQISVVLIEAQRPTKSPLPVAVRNLVALPFNRPTIESISRPTPTPEAPITLNGQNLRAENVVVHFGAEAVTPAPADISADRIQVTLPNTLRAGINTVRVSQPIDFGTSSPDEPHRGFESNVFAFMLAPRITLPTPNSIARGSNLTLTVEPKIEREQKVALIIGDRAIAIPARAVDSLPSNTIDIPIPTNFPIGEFLVRLRVDGAESELERDRATNLYTGPKIEIS